MKITTKQSIQLNMARWEFLNSISIYEETVKIVEKKCDCKMSQKSFIEKLKETLEELNVEELKKMSGVEYGYRIGEHIGNMEKIILKEFSMIISPFDKILEKYSTNLFIIFILPKMNK